MDDGALALDNNRCERAIRQVVMGRRHHESAGNGEAERSGAVWLAEIGAGAATFITGRVAARAVTLHEKSPE